LDGGVMARGSLLYQISCLGRQTPGGTVIVFCMKEGCVVDRGDNSERLSARIFSLMNLPFMIEHSIPPATKKSPSLIFARRPVFAP